LNYLKKKYIFNNLTYFFNHFKDRNQDRNQQSSIKKSHYENIFFKATPYLALFWSSFNQAQETKTVTTVNNKSASKYNYHDSLDPIFYTKTAQNLDQQGQPGAKYWQNKADYKLTAILNEKNNEMVQEILTYTNNSPDKISFMDECRSKSV
jgi:hypothetical protein